jgi:hypothetical protein
MALRALDGRVKPGHDMYGDARLHHDLTKKTAFGPAPAQFPFETAVVFSC